MWSPEILLAALEDFRYSWPTCVPVWHQNQYNVRAENANKYLFK